MLLEVDGMIDERSSINYEAAIMNINRNNYEEFFVLYADNELSAAEKLLVETFVRENPDLQQELNLLRQSKLVADHNVVFENKELLMRSSLDANSLINHSNYEEFFLLYFDNELNDEDRKAVEKFVDKYPSLWHEMMMLQKARVEADQSIVYAGKEKLYRRENKKIFFIGWQRIAAAAAVLLIAGLLVFRYSNSKTNNGVVSKKVERPNTTTAKKDKEPVTSPNTDTLHNRSTEKEEQQLAAGTKPNKQKRSVSKKNIVIDNATVLKEPKEKEYDIAPVVVENKNTADDKVINTGKINIPADAVAIMTNIKTQEPDKKQGTEPQIRQASFIDQADSQREDQNGFLAFSTKKNKMRGIFRKVSRVFEKTTNVEGDKSSVLIGNFQIAVK